MTIGHDDSTINIVFPLFIIIIIKDIRRHLFVKEGREWRAGKEEKGTETTLLKETVYRYREKICSSSSSVDQIHGPL